MLKKIYLMLLILFSFFFNISSILGYGGEDYENILIELDNPNTVLDTTKIINTDQTNDFINNFTSDIDKAKQKLQVSKQNLENTSIGLDDFSKGIPSNEASEIKTVFDGYQAVQEVKVNTEELLKTAEANLKTNQENLENQKTELSKVENNRLKIEKEIKKEIGYDDKEIDNLEKKFKDIENDITSTEESLVIAKNEVKSANNKVNEIKISEAQRILDNPNSTKKEKAQAAEDKVKATQALLNNDPKNEELKSELEAAEKELNERKEVYDNSTESDNDIRSRGFIISVNDISPGMTVKHKTTSENVNQALGTIIQKLMIGLGSFAMIIMTIGAGYIILHSGQDEILSKGKAIFMSGVYALFAALASYYLVSIFRYILFN